MFKWILLASLLLCGCAAPKTKVRVLVPAEHGQVTRYRNIAVLPFTGDDAQSIADELEAQLAVVIVKGKPFFNVVERERLTYALQELALSQKGLLNPKNALQVGRFIGAEALYTGQVQTTRVDREYYEETRQECIEHKDPDKKRSKCLKYQDKSVDCTRKTAHFRMIPKLIVVETGQIIYSKNIGKTAESAHCEDESSPPANDQSLIDEAKQAAFQEFKRDIAPSYVEQELTMMDDVDGLPESASERFKAALTFAEKDRMDRACTLWSETAQLASPTVAVIFNLGVCAETQSDYAQALHYYHKVDGMLLKPDDIVSEALSRIRQKIRQQRSLKQQI